MVVAPWRTIKVTAATLRYMSLTTVRFLQYSDPRCDKLSCHADHRTRGGGGSRSPARSVAGAPGAAFLRPQPRAMRGLLPIPLRVRGGGSDQAVARGVHHRLPVDDARGGREDLSRVAVHLDGGDLAVVVAEAADEELAARPPRRGDDGGRRKVVDGIEKPGELDAAQGRRPHVPSGETLDRLVVAVPHELRELDADHLPDQPLPGQVVEIVSDPPLQLVVPGPAPQVDHVGRAGGALPERHVPEVARLPFRGGGA